MLSTSAAAMYTPPRRTRQMRWRQSISPRFEQGALAVRRRRYPMSCKTEGTGSCKRIAARRFSRPLPYQLGLALPAHKDRGRPSLRATDARLKPATRPSYVPPLSFLTGGGVTGALLGTGRTFGESPVAPGSGSDGWAAKLKNSSMRAARATCSVRRMTAAAPGRSPRLSSASARMSPVFTYSAGIPTDARSGQRPAGAPLRSRSRGSPTCAVTALARHQQRVTPGVGMLGVVFARPCITR